MDTTRLSDTIRRSHTTRRLTARTSSAGLFNFSGRICTDNPAFDISGMFEYRRWGLTAFQVVDLYDRNTNNNFTFGLLYKRLVVDRRLTITPHIGYIIGEWGKSCGDRELLLTSYRISPQWTIDHLFLFSNLLTDDEKDWVNRVRISWAADAHLDLMLAVWHNNNALDENSYVSSAFHAGYNRIKVAKHVTLNTGIVALLMPKTSDEELFPRNNGIVLQIAAIFE